MPCTGCCPPVGRVRYGTTRAINVRAAMDPAGKILVIETVIPQGDTVHFGKLMNIVMLACLTGRERTETEFAPVRCGHGLLTGRSAVWTAPSRSISLQKLRGARPEGVPM